MKKKLAIVTSHPIQYNAPLFQLLTIRDQINVKVFYTWSQAKENVYDPGFQNDRKWDLPLMEGYDHLFVENTAKRPGTHHFYGIRNPSLNKMLSQWDPDAILVYGWAFESHLKCMRYFKNKIPVLFRGDSTLLDESKNLKTVLRRIFLRWVYRHVDKILYVGENNRRYFEKHGLKKHQLVKAPHAVDNSRFSQPVTKEQVDIFRKELGIGSNHFVVLFAGKFEEKKNPFYLLELAKIMKDEDIRFLFVGSGILESRLKRKAIADNRIVFLPFQNQRLIPLVYQSVNVFILPSNGPGETWGLAANEAMACGLPVLLSNKVGGAKDLINNNGLLFRTSEYKEVKNFILQLKRNRTFYKSCSELSKNHIQNFTFEKIAETIEAILT